MVTSRPHKTATLYSAPNTRTFILHKTFANQYL
uniref:Uncharacterized protein n=1 Tax=Anguilla anguilla TaxID=7936 RepID=A0A0E9WG29_ANGAN